jgi:hypothetical protein
MMLTCIFMQFQISSQLLGRNGIIWGSIGRLSTGKGSRMSQALIPVEALSSVCWENGKKRKRRKREEARGFFPREKTTCWLCQAGFSQLLGAIRG